MGRSSDYEVEKLDFRESAALLTDGRSVGWPIASEWTIKQFMRTYDSFCFDLRCPCKTIRLLSIRGCSVEAYSTNVVQQAPS